MNFNEVIVYSKDYCPYCQQAEALLKRENIEYKLLKLGVDFEREEVFEVNPAATTFPQIVIDGVAIGGFTDLIPLFETRKQ